MIENIKKRVVIILAYLVIFSVVGWGFYAIFGTKATCFDNMKNQNEEDVDCGGVCFKKCGKIEAQALVVGEVGVVESSIVGQYDFFGIVSNPNSLYGSASFDYQVKFSDEAGMALGEKSGHSFILPGDRKYIIENNITLPSVPAKIEMTISNSSWIEFNEEYSKPELKIINKTYGPITDGVGFYEAKGLLKNDSPYDFAAIKIGVILKDVTGKVVALNSTEVQTVRSNEVRDFRVFWPGRFAGEVTSPETQIEVNIFDSDSFDKKNIKAQQFQNYSN